LAEQPRPSGCRKVRGLPPGYEVYRVKVGDTHRIIYQIRDQMAWILVVKVADRKDVYKRMTDLKRSLG
jgi:mRNA-degrading endonuclease RelE of RelBE toxin-antitoxin system